MPSRPIAFARSVIMVFLHALHTLFARWEDHVAVFSCFIAWLIPPWLVARLMSWTCMAIGIITIGAAVPVMSYVTYERTMTDVDTNDFGQKAKGSLDYALGLAAASAMVAAVFAIISGACECIPPIPVLWCINLGSSAASSLAALLSFAFFAGANGLVVLSLVKANDFTLVFWAVLAFLVLLITLLNAVFIVATMLPGLKLVAFFVAQVLFALTLAIFYFDEIMDDYYYSSGRALPGEPWAVPIRLVLIYFLAMCGTIALATAICSLNELVHVIPGVGFLVDILGLSLMGAEFGAATAGIRALPTPSPRAFSVEDGFSPNSKVAYLKEPPDSQVF
mmetsp:Transcript_3888/g.12053  ORF Transcript_3888/g.12053 Transcript_3888/m.12053 type:complete len:335 (-) Transcript_3888:1040-2044(-)